MKISKFITLSLALSSVLSAHALPGSRFARPCGDNSAVERNLGELLHKINLGEVDSRGSLTEIGPELGITPEEDKQIRMTTGTVSCNGKVYYKLDPRGYRVKGADGQPVIEHTTSGGSLGGFLSGTGNTLNTNTHAFVDEDGYRRDLSTCTFTNFDRPQVTRKLVFEDKPQPTYKFGTQNYKIKGQGNFDFAMVRLDKKIPGAIPFERIAPDKHVGEDEPLIMISAIQLNMNHKIPSNEPIAQGCKSRKTWAGNDQVPSVVTSDCSATPGSSASVYFQRDAWTNKLVAVAMHISSGPENLDHTPYNFTPETNRTGTYSGSYAVGLDAVVGYQLSAFESSPAVMKTAEGISQRDHKL